MPGCWFSFVARLVPTQALLFLLACSVMPLVEPQFAVAQEEVTVEKGVVILHRTFGSDMPAFAPNGKTIAICGNEAVRFVDAKSGRRFANALKDKSYPRDVYWMPDGKSLVTLGDQIVVWNSQGTVLRIPADEFATSERPAFFTALAVSPDGKSLAIGLQTGEAVLVPLDNRGAAKRLKGGHREAVKALLWHGDTLYSGGAYGDGHVCVWNTQTGDLQKKFAAHEREVKALAVSPDGKTLVTLGGKGEVVLWNPLEGKPLVKMPVDASLASETMQDGGVAFLNEGQVVLAAQGQNLGLWTAQGEPIQTLTGHDDWIRKIDVHPRTGRVVTAGGSTVRIWKIRDMLPPGLDRPLPPVRRNPAAVLASRKMNNLANWKGVRGDWKMQDGSLWGAGDSRINFPQEFPNDLSLRFKLKVHNETNPRVRFGSFHFGYEGREQRFFLHGPKAKGEFFPFEYDTQYEIQVNIEGDTATLWIDGQQVAQSHPKRNDKRTIAIEGGGLQSQGASEFYDFQIDYNPAWAPPAGS